MRHVKILTNGSPAEKYGEIDAYGYCGNYQGQDVCGTCGYYDTPDYAHCEYADDICTDLDNAACYYAAEDYCNYDHAGCEYYGGPFPGTDDCSIDWASGCSETYENDYCGTDYD